MYCVTVHPLMTAIFHSMANSMVRPREIHNERFWDKPQLWNNCTLACKLMEWKIIVQHSTHCMECIYLLKIAR